jgi:putative DNA primase/helicase
VSAADLVLLPPPTEPMQVARQFVDERCTDPPGPLVLRHWRGGWWSWNESRWVEVEVRAVRAELYRYTEHARFTDDKGNLGRWAPNRYKIANLLDALAAIVYLPESVAMPSWLDERSHDGLIVSVQNGLLDVGRRELLDHTPSFFNATAVPFPYDEDAPTPARWSRFLRELWGEDTDSVSVLAEWFGYVVSGRLDLHKILLLVGPTRAGKGVIARTLGQLVGVDNVAGPTLSSLSGDFGLAPLLGKTLAVVSDARLNGRNGSVVVERLLSISGEDTLTVNRKYREQWTGKLPSRLMLCSNELPQLGDASMAITGRFVPLLLERSWYGREDLGLEDELAGELSGILNWALAGLEALTERGRFTRPPSVDDTIRILQDLASPVAAFVRERCTRGPDEQVAVDELYKAWRAWAGENGHTQTNKSTFGRDLRAALAGRLRVSRPWGSGEDRPRVYIGVGLTGGE